MIFLCVVNTRSAEREGIPEHRAYQIFSPVFKPKKKCAFKIEWEDFSFVSRLTKMMKCLCDCIKIRAKHTSVYKIIALLPWTLAAFLQQSWMLATAGGLDVIISSDLLPGFSDKCGWTLSCLLITMHWVLDHYLRYIVNLDLASFKIRASLPSFYIYSSLWGLKLLFYIPGPSSSVVVTSFAALCMLCVWNCHCK